ncbi:hypothetical protein ACJJTC_019457 [Scirpophaga incertulas]
MKMELKFKKSVKNRPQNQHNPSMAIRHLGYSRWVSRFFVRILCLSFRDVLAKKLVDVIHTCEKQFDHENDDCWRILHIAECFKVTCQRDDLAPTMEMLLAEFIMEAEA